MSIGITYALLTWRVAGANGTLLKTPYQSSYFNHNSRNGNIFLQFFEVYDSFGAKCNQAHLRNGDNERVLLVQKAIG